MAVIVGSARIDERGKATGGKAGDQTGKEVGTQNWYLHKKGWRVFRCVDAEKAKMIAAAMKAACANKHIGYDQAQRSTLQTVSAKYGYDPSKVTTDCETDCSALVRVCCAYAGIMMPVFYTATEANTLLNTGMFVELTGDKYTKQSNYLMTGDILCTAKKSHTVVVLTDGNDAEYGLTLSVKEYDFGKRDLKNGCEGADVKILQQYLIDLGYSCGDYGADGDFGDATELAVIAFQQSKGLTADGICGSKTYEALEEELNAEDEAEEYEGVQIIGGNCYVRSAATTDSSKLGVAYKNYIYPFLGKEDNGWYCIEFKSNEGWVSGKYAKLIYDV